MQSTHQSIKRRRINVVHKVHGRSTVHAPKTFVRKSIKVLAPRSILPSPKLQYCSFGDAMYPQDPSVLPDRHAAPAKAVRASCLDHTIHAPGQHQPPPFPRLHHIALSTMRQHLGQCSIDIFIFQHSCIHIPKHYDRFFRLQQDSPIVVCHAAPLRSIKIKGRKLFGRGKKTKSQDTSATRSGAPFAPN